MHSTVARLTSIQTSLAEACAVLRQFKDDTPSAFSAWSHACEAHTSISMAIDNAKDAEAAAEQDRVAST